MPNILPKTSIVQEFKEREIIKKRQEEEKKHQNKAIARQKQLIIIRKNVENNYVNALTDLNNQLKENFSSLKTQRIKNIQGLIAQAEINEVSVPNNRLSELTNVILWACDLLENKVSVDSALADPLIKKLFNGCCFDNSCSCILHRNILEGILIAYTKKNYLSMLRKLCDKLKEKLCIIHSEQAESIQALITQAEKIKNHLAFNSLDKLTKIIGWAGDLLDNQASDKCLFDLLNHELFLASNRNEYEIYRGIILITVILSLGLMAAGIAGGIVMPYSFTPILYKLAELLLFFMPLLIIVCPSPRPNLGEEIKGISTYFSYPEHPKTRKLTEIVTAVI